MKVVYKTYCDIDVHKKFLIATIIKPTKGIQPSYQKKRFSTFNGDIHCLKSWLLDIDCHNVCMESTGKYQIPVFNLLENEINVTIANPKWIGDRFRPGIVPASFISCKEIRILREYTRYRFKLMSCNRGEKNRFQNALTVCNVALDSIVSDMFEKSASTITDYLISTDSFDT